MRIIAGKLRHRQILMTNLDTTRETQDRIRGAIFNMIGPYFDGGSALDLFAGSGAMGIEAYSRGIGEIYLNDLEAKALEICRKNCENLQIDAHFFSLDYRLFCKECPKTFDLIFLDPPYAMNQIEEILYMVFPLSNPSGKIVFEMDSSSIYPTRFPGLSLWKEHLYGRKRVVIYRREK